MTNLKIYCVSDKPIASLEKLNLILAGVGQKNFPNNYITCLNGINIQNKEKYYSELTFHYWLWKNEFKDLDNETWIGFCQKRRFWINENSSAVNSLSDLNENILRKIPRDWEKYDAFLCEPIKVSPAKTTKLIKRGWKNWLKNPSILFDKRKHNIKLQFDMFHGYGILDSAIDIMKFEHREEFRNYVNTNIEFNPHIMVISKKLILDKWFEDLFSWLFECEKLFGFQNLKGYDTGRLYAYLSERYLPFWFNKFYKSKNLPWVFFDTTV